MLFFFSYNCSLSFNLNNFVWNANTFRFRFERNSMHIFRIDLYDLLCFSVSFSFDFTNSSVFIGFCRAFCSIWLLGCIDKLSQINIDRHITCATHKILRSNTKWPYFISIFQRHWRCWCWITRHHKMATLLCRRGNFSLNFFLQKKKPSNKMMWQFMEQSLWIGVKIWFALP